MIGEGHTPLLLAYPASSTLSDRRKKTPVEARCVRYLTNDFSRGAYKEIGILIFLLSDTRNCRAWFLDLRGFFCLAEKHDVQEKPRRSGVPLTSHISGAAVVSVCLRNTLLSLERPSIGPRYWAILSALNSWLHFRANSPVIGHVRFEFRCGPLTPCEFVD